MTSAIDVTKPINGTPTTQSVRDNFAIAKSEITALQTSMAALIGAGKNAVINPNFNINQRNVSGTVTLAAGVYGHDRWKAGSSGCTYTYTIGGGISTLIITAGTLQQVIEGNNLPLGTNTCVLSWTGTAQGRFGSGSWGNTGMIATVVGGTNLTIEFGTGTLSLVQLEKGSTATLYEQRPYPLEMALCKYYYEQITSVATQAIANGVTNSASAAYIFIGYAQKRAAPTIALSSGWMISAGSVACTASAITSQYTNTTGAGIIVSFSGTVSVGLAAIFYADTTAGRTITMSAEL